MKGPAKIFISYARRDGRDLAHRLRNDLQKKKHTVWLDTSEIAAGAQWTREIEDGIDNCDVLLALLSDGSYASTICRAEQLRALRKEKRLIPLLVNSQADRPIHIEGVNYRDFSARARYRTALKQLLDDLGGAITATLPEKYLRTYVTADPLPTTYVPRPAKLEELRRAVIDDDGRGPVAVTALRGLGGIGKTVLAQALCKDEVVQAAFPDGVVWTTIGRTPGDLVSQMHEVGKALDDLTGEYNTLDSSKNSLRTALQGKAALVVLDDVWDVQHVQPFLSEERRCRVLFTTRNGNISSHLGADEVRLDVMEPGPARALLIKWAGRDESEFGRIAERLGYLPLALKIAGARLKEGMTAAEWLATFEHVSQIKLGRYSNDPGDNLKVCFDVTIEQLAEADRRFYDALGVFPEDLAVPEQVVVRLWRGMEPSLSKVDCVDLLRELERWALIERDADKQITLHDLLYDYTRERLGGGLQGTHRHLLAAYNPGNKPWHQVEDDGYLYRHLAYHLREAGRSEELENLLLDFDWLQAKLAAAGVAALVADYDVPPPNEDMQSIQGAVRLSVHAVARDSKQLAGQLVGRLTSFKSDRVRRFLAQTTAWRRAPWLQPLTASLTPPGGPLLRTLTGHSEWVRAVAVSADGRRAVSGSYDQTVKVWDLDSGAELHSLTGHSGWVDSVAVSADGRRAVSGSSDATVKVWDLDSGAELHSLAGHGGWVWSVAVSADGRRAVSGSDDQTVKVWDLESGAELHSLAGHGGGVSSVAVSAHGRRAVSGSSDATVKVWDLESGAELHSLAGHSAGVSSVAVSADGRRAVSGSDDQTVKVWDLESGAELHSLAGHGGGVSSVAVSADGRRAVSGSSDQTMKVWDLESGAELHSLASHSGLVMSVAVSADGRRAVSGSDDRTVKVWDLEGGAEVHSLAGHIDRVSSLAASADGRRAISGSFDQTIKVWDLESGAELHSLAGHSGWVRSVAVSADGRRGVSGSDDATVKVWDLESGAELHSLQGHSDWVSSVAVSADGGCAVSGSSDRTMKVWDLANGAELHSLSSHSGWVLSLAVSADGRRGVSGSDDATVKVWDLESGAELHSLDGHSDWVRSVAVSADGRRGVSGSDDATVKVWDLGSGAELHSLASHSGGVLSVAVSADSRRGVSGSQDHTVKVWDLESGAELHSLAGHSGGVSAVAVSADGRRAVSGSYDHTVKVWDLESGEAIAGFHAEGAVGGCAMSPDGLTVVVGDASGRVHFLRLEGVEPTTAGSASVVA